MKLVKAVLLTVGLLGLTNINAAPLTLVAGEDYEVTAAQGSEEPILEEFFNYACGACYSMEKFIGDFKAGNPDVKVKPVPVELHAAWKIYVKAYYIGEKLGVLEQSHSKLFHRIHVEKKPLKGEDDMKAFYLSLGVAEKDYDDIAKSYWLDTQLRLSKQYAFKNKIMSTPTLLVNKRYKLDTKNLASFEKIEQAIRQLSGASENAVAAQ